MVVRKSFRNWKLASNRAESDFPTLTLTLTLTLTVTQHLYWQARIVPAPAPSTKRPEPSWSWTTWCPSWSLDCSAWCASWLTKCCQSWLWYLRLYTVTSSTQLILIGSNSSECFQPCSCWLQCPSWRHCSRTAPSAGAQFCPGSDGCSPCSWSPSPPLSPSAFEANRIDLKICLVYSFAFLLVDRFWEIASKFVLEFLLIFNFVKKEKIYFSVNII